MRPNSMREELPHSVMSILEAKLKILCDVCNQQVLQPKICPSCNQIFCTQCLVKYHDSYKNCPMCHQKFTLNQFLDCDCHRFIDYFRQQLKQFKLVTKSSDKKMIAYEVKSFNPKEIQQQEKCHLHEIPLKYFCETCSKPICSDCGMMSDEHRDHKFTRINDIYAKIKQKLNNELANLSKKIMDYQQNSLMTKKKLQKLQIQYMHIKRYTQEYYLLLIEKFQQQIKTKTICLKEIQEKNNKDIEFYELCRDGICEEIQRKSRNQLIAETDKILSSFTMQTCQPCEPLIIEESFETIKQLMPDYSNFQYSLRNFSQATSSIVYSDPFILNGVEWRLKIYPKGNGVAKGKYLSVFVEMSKAEKNQKKYEYKIQLINHEMSAQNIRRQYCSAFDIGECWGYNQFILLQELQNSFKVDDTLHFIMGIRNSDYRTLSQDQSNYIAKLQASIKQRQQQLQSQVEETNIIDDLDNPSYANQNETKFLKFLENSSLNEEKINQKKSKEKSRQNKSQQKKQQQKQQKKSKQKKQFKYNKKLQEKVENEKFMFNEFQRQIKGQERTTNNLQQNLIKSSKQRKLLQNQFLLAEDEFQSQEQNYMKFSLSEQKIQSKSEEIQKTKKKKSHQQEKFESKQKGYSSPGNKFISLKELKSQKFISNNQSKSSIMAEIKPQKKQREKDLLLKQQQNNSKKYQFYFTESKKQPKKQQYKELEQNKSSKKNFDLLESTKKIKSELKETKISSDLRQFQKIEQSKSQIFNNHTPIDLQKYQQKRQKMNIKLSKNPKNSPSKIKDFMDQNETRKKQITSILQQSKKLEGITEINKNAFVENSSGIKQSGSSQSAIKSPTKNQFKMQQKQEKRKYERKFQQDEDY